MFSYDLLPLINKPTRVNLNSATLIHNIFTNSPNSKVNGVLINDISDHMPIFSIISNAQYAKSPNKKLGYKKTVRKEDINNIKTELNSTDWSSIYETQDTNKAYNIFIEQIQLVCNKHYPLKRVNGKKVINKPWVTKGILKAHKKQKVLYKRFMMNRTAAYKAKYKIYRNKLTNIKRFCEKNYYTKLIENNKNNVKNIWRALNEIINKKVKSNEYPNQFKTEDVSTISGTKMIANKFNDFFVNVGTNLAKQIKVEDNSNIYDNLGPTNTHSMFLSPVSENEIINK